LCGILGFVKINGKEDIVRRKTQRRRLASTEEEGNILHLHKGHRRLLVFDARKDREVD